MRPLLTRRLFAALAMLLPLSAFAAPTAYIAAWNTLYQLDLATAQATRIGNGIGFNDVEGLAFAPDGVLYAVADGTAGSGSAQTDFLIRINPETGVGTLVGSLTGLAGQGPNGQLDYGLTFTCDGRLWASSDTTGRFWEVNPSNAGVREVGNTGYPISDLAARGKQLYGIGVQNGFGNHDDQALYRINPDTAEAIRIGSLGVSDKLSSSGADFDSSGVLWATLDSQPPDVDRPSRLARINLSTGQATVLGSITGIDDNISARAMAIGPPGGCATTGGGNAAVEPTLVPGPGLPALILLGVVTIWTGRRRLY